MRTPFIILSFLLLTICSTALRAYTSKNSPDSSETQNNTVKEIWIATYNGPEDDLDRANDIVVDKDGNVYVTGSSATNGFYGRYKCTTVKYDKGGHELWVLRYSTYYHLMCECNALTIDRDGAVFTTGEEWEPDYGASKAITMKISPDGEMAWVDRSDEYTQYDGGMDIALDHEGKVVMTGQSESNYYTIQYDKDGVIQWSDQYEGTGEDRDRATALVIDPESNVYVTGSSTNSGTSLDYTTIKYNSQGQRQWIRNYNGPVDEDDQAEDIVIDSEGYLSVTGWSTGDGTGTDYVTIKYDSEGNEIWVARYNGPGFGEDEPQAMAVDDSGNVFVTGWSDGELTERDYTTIKYNPDGEVLWIRRYDGPAENSNDDRAYDIAVDKDGDAYVTGKTVIVQEGWNSNYDYATIKYSGEGEELWIAIYGSEVFRDSHDEAYAIAVDHKKQVYVTGKYWRELLGSHDIATIKYGQINIDDDEFPPDSLSYIEYP